MASISSSFAPAFLRVDSSFDVSMKSTPYFFISAMIPLGYIFAKQGKYDEALSEMKKAAAQDPLHFPPGIGYVYALSGETLKAREILRQELDRRKREGVVDTHIATIYVALGEKEKAIESLEEAFREKAPDLQWVKADPVFASLNDEPRFQALMKKIGFPE